MLQHVNLDNFKALSEIDACSLTHLLESDEGAVLTNSIKPADFGRVIAYLIAIDTFASTPVNLTRWRFTYLAESESHPDQPLSTQVKPKFLVYTMLEDNSGLGALQYEVEFTLSQSSPNLALGAPEALFGLPVVSEFNRGLFPVREGSISSKPTASTTRLEKLKELNVFNLTDESFMAALREACGGQFKDVLRVLKNADEELVAENGWEDTAPWSFNYGYDAAGQMQARFTGFGKYASDPEPTEHYRNAYFVIFTTLVMMPEGVQTGEWAIAMPVVKQRAIPETAPEATRYANPAWTPEMVEDPASLTTAVADLLSDVAKAVWVSAKGDPAMKRIVLLKQALEIVRPMKTGLFNSQPVPNSAVTQALSMACGRNWELAQRIDSAFMQLEQALAAHHWAGSLWTMEIITRDEEKGEGVIRLHLRHADAADRYSHVLFQLELIIERYRGEWEIVGMKEAAPISPGNFHALGLSNVIHVLNIYNYVNAPVDQKPVWSSMGARTIMSTNGEPFRLINRLIEELMRASSAPQIESAVRAATGGIEPVTDMLLFALKIGPKTLAVVPASKWDGQIVKAGGDEPYLLNLHLVSSGHGSRPLAPFMTVSLVLANVDQSDYTISSVHQVVVERLECFDVGRLDTFEERDRFKAMVSWWQPVRGVHPELFRFGAVYDQSPQAFREAGIGYHPQGRWTPDQMPLTPRQAMAWLDRPNAGITTNTLDFEVFEDVAALFSRLQRGFGDTAGVDNLRGLMMMADLIRRETNKEDGPKVRFSITTIGRWLTVDPANHADVLLKVFDTASGELLATMQCELHPVKQDVQS